MSPLFLYPALSGRGGGVVGDSGPNFVFRNGERLKMLEEPNTSGKQFFRSFGSPCYRIPAMVITDSGRIIVASDYRSKPDDQVAIIPCVAYSDDNGKTWNKKIIYDQRTWFHDNRHFRIMDSTMWLDKEGGVHILSGYWQGTANNTNWTQHRNDRTWNVVEFVSRDNGENWTMVLDYKSKIRGLPEGSSWLGGVGNCVTTKQGTYIIPIQFSPATGQVSMTFIYSNDGITWNLFPGSVAGCSETSVSQWVNHGGNTELLFISRKDPNTGNKKKAVYVVQNTNGSFAKNTFTDYGVYNDKIPARGNSGCQGSNISASDINGNLAPRNTVLVSYPKNFFSTIQNFERDHIVVSGFPWTDPHDTSENSRQLKELDMINVNPGGERAGTPFGGYSMINYNHAAKKLGIAYENMLGICYKDLSHLIPQFLGEPAV